MNNEDIKYAIPACTHLNLFYLTLFILFGFSFSLLSTKVSVHATGIVLRGRSLKIVKPAPQQRSSQAEPPSLGEFYFLPSFLPVLIIYQTAAILHLGLSFLKVFFYYFFGHKQALNKSTSSPSCRKQFIENIFDDVQHFNHAPPCLAEVLVNKLFTCSVFSPSIKFNGQRRDAISSDGLVVPLVWVVFPLSVTCLFCLCSCLPFSHELGITSLIICTKYEINDNSEKVLHKKIQLPGLKKSEGNKKKLHGHFFKCHKNLVKQPSI